MNSSDRELLTELRDLGVVIKDSSSRDIGCICPNPDHADNNPSFFFNLDTQLYHCFAPDCLRGKGIDQLRFKLTGEKVVREVKINPLTLNKTQTKSRVVPKIPILPLAAHNLGESYLAGRGIFTESIKEWNLLYWKDSPWNMPGIVIPIEGVGYIFRSIGNKTYKYIPGTRIETTLFGIDRFYSPDRSVLLVEGSLDVIWLHQCGFKNALGLLHSDISKIQMTLLLGTTLKIYLMLDEDQGGIDAVEKIKPRLKEHFIVRICHLPEGKDPNDCTKEELEETIKNAKNGG